jgi:hypothetical protein
MTIKFRTFLKKYGLYDKYITNNKGESDNPYVYFDNFHWESTEEGSDFWAYWDSVWYDILVDGEDYV